MANDLAKALAKIDSLLDDGTRAKMRAPASPASLKKLSKVVLGGKPVPRDLETFLRWHDGQSDVGHIHPDDYRSTMRIDQVIDAWKFLTDPSEEVEGFEKSWVPLFSNGAGDYVCFETGGKRVGALVEYWHTDEDRDVSFPSLLAWAEHAAMRLAPKKPKKSAPRIVLDATKTKWKKLAKPPTHAQVAKRPIGTAFHWDQIPTHPRIPHAHVFIKLEMGGEKNWRTSRAETPADAIAKIQQMLDAPKAPDDSFWKSDDFTVAFDAKEQMYDDGADEPVPVVVHESVIAIHQR